MLGLALLASACDREVPPAPRAAAVPAVSIPPAAAPTTTPAPAVASPVTPTAPPPIAAAAVSTPTPVSLPAPAVPPAPTPAVTPDAVAAPPPAVEPISVPPPLSIAPPAADGPGFPDDVALASGKAWIAVAGRSPLGAPSEVTPQPARRLGDVAVVNDPPATTAVRWDQAHRHVGERITVQGRVVNTHRSKSNVVFLNFDRDWKGKFYIPVFRGAYESMPVAAERYFLNKTVRVTGEVEIFNGAPNIEVNQLSQISVVGR